MTVEYGICLGILAGFGILFLKSHGGFQRAASFLRKHSRTAELLVSEETLKRMLLLIFAADLLAIAADIITSDNDASQNGYLYREEYGGEVSEQTVLMEKNGQEKQVRIFLEPRKLTKKEKEEALKKVMRSLPERVLGGQNAGHVTRNVTLPDTAGSPEVCLEWMTDRPDIIDWDGAVGDKIPVTGAEVTLTCELSLDDAVKETSLKLMVFPKEKNEEEKLEEDVNETVAKENSETNQKVKLPDKISGEKVHWKQNETHGGIRILLAGVLLCASVMVFRKKEENEKKQLRIKGLKADYPNIISRFALFMNAGMSVRMSLEKMAENFRENCGNRAGKSNLRILKNRTPEGTHPGFEEVCHIVDDMRNGMMEQQAFERLGRRCGIAEYRTFSDLLIRCSVKGGRDVLNLMQKTAEEAEDMKRRQARIRGEEAGTRMLLPMVLMLAIVMAILMVPAMLTMR